MCIAMLEPERFRVYLPSIKTDIQKGEEQHLELLTEHGELVLVTEDSK